MKPHDVLHRLKKVSNYVLHIKSMNANSRIDDMLVELNAMVYNLADDIAVHLPDNEFEKYGAIDLMDKV